MDFPEEAIDPNVPAGTPPGQAAKGRLKDFWCGHKVRFMYVPGKGQWLPQVEPGDPMHPANVSVCGEGALPIACHDPGITAFDPDKYPNAGPHAVARARREVEAELRERRRQQAP